MATYRRIHWVGICSFLVFVAKVFSKPLPQSTVTQSGEPSHFQVDDKAAEIEVNANPAGVKVNAKPASLQVVAKPGTPAIPVYHPAIHIAPHYLPPPIIHREPAMFYHHHHHHHPCLPPMCFGRSRGWFYAGLRRDDLPKPVSNLHQSFNEDTQGDKSSTIPRPSDSRDLDERDTLGHELDEDGRAITRNHKSSIPRPEKEHKHKSSRKRQFIAGAPMLYQPQALSPLRTLPYAMQQYGAMLSSRAPLARNIISSYGRVPMGLGSMGPNAMSSLYGQSLSSSALGGLSPSQFGLNALGMYGGSGQQQFIPSPALTARLPGYNLGSAGPKGNAISNFLQSELSHELYGASSPVRSPLRLEQGYGRSIISPYEQQPSGYGAIAPGRGLESMGNSLERAYGMMSPGGSLGGMGSPYGAMLQGRSLENMGNSLGGSLQPGYQGGLAGNYGNSASMQMEKLYGSEPPPASIPGLQSFTEAPDQPGQSFGYQYLPGQGSMATRSKVPGSRLPSKKSNEPVVESQEKDDDKASLEKNESTKDKTGTHENVDNSAGSKDLTTNVNEVKDDASNASKSTDAANDTSNTNPSQSSKINQEITSNVTSKSVEQDQVQAPKESENDSKESGSTKDHVSEKKSKEEKGEEKKSRKRRQLLGGYDLDTLQDALVNEFKREMILGAPAEPPPIPFNNGQSSLGLPLPGIQGISGGNQGNLMGVPQMATLDANYISPVERFNPSNLGNPMMRAQAINSMALGRSQVSPDQIRVMPDMADTVTSRYPMHGRAPFIRQGLIQNRPNGFISNNNEYIGSPMRFNQDYRSPIEYDERRPSRFRRPGHPLYRRRLHHSYYDDDYDYDDDDDYHESRPLYHDHLGRERASFRGSYTENEIPNEEGETLVDTSNHGFGPIEVEAKTAEGLSKSLRELKRGKILKPNNKELDGKTVVAPKEEEPFQHGVL